MPDKPMEQPAFLNLSFVTRCVDHLRRQKIHRQFAGYLCVCSTAALEGRRETLKPGFKAFFDRFLLVGEPPESTPYLVPFNESGVPEASVWFNGNVAGSYAVSSIRPQAPLRRVVELFGSGKAATFSLRDEHEEACLQYLLFGKAINAVALAGFLFRDHSFLVSDRYSPTVTDLVNELYALLGFKQGGFSQIIFTEDKEFEFGQVWAPVDTPTSQLAS